MLQGGLNTATNSDPTHDMSSGQHCLPTRNGDGQTGWSPIGCEGLYFHGMCKNRVFVSGWSPISYECFRTNWNIPCPLPLLQFSAKKLSVTHMGVAGTIVHRYCGSFPHSPRLPPARHSYASITAVVPHVYVLQVPNGLLDAILIKGWPKKEHPSIYVWCSYHSQYLKYHTFTPETVNSWVKCFVFFLHGETTSVHMIDVGFIIMLNISVSYP